MKEKTPWSGRVVGVQPRIFLLRSMNQYRHSYQGYALIVEGALGAASAGTFVVGVGASVHEKHAFRAGDVVQGWGVPPARPETEAVDLYRASGLRFTARGDAATPSGPPHRHLAPPLSVYKERRRRRLDAQRYASHCRPCTWGCEMPVEIIVDPWKPGHLRHRRETFCYGPKSCALYLAGPRRTVPLRKGLSWTEEDSVDEEATAHRGPDE